MSPIQNMFSLLEDIRSPGSADGGCLRAACCALAKQRSSAPSDPPPVVRESWKSACGDEFFPWEYCEDCDMHTVGDVTGAQVEFSCPECGALFRRPCEEELAMMEAADFNGNVKSCPRLRVVGADNIGMQRRLDSAFTANSDESGYRDLVAELKSFNKEFKENTGKQYPEDVLKEVALIYVNEVRKKKNFEGDMKVKRGQNKQSMIAVLLARMTQNRGWSESDASTFMQLRSSGLAHGESRLRRLDACVDILEGNQENDFVDAAFAAVGLVYNPHVMPEVSLGPGDDNIPIVDADSAKLIETLKKAAISLLEVCDKKRIGTQPVPRTRATGAVFVVLRRAHMKGLVPESWESICGPGSLDKIAEKCNIRKQTLDSFVSNFTNYHRLFSSSFKKWGISSKKAAL